MRVFGAWAIFTSIILTSCDSTGGSIVRVSTTTVLGLVSHGIQGRGDVWTMGTRYSDIRKFGARMDRQIKWTKMPQGPYTREPQDVLKIYLA